MPDIHNNSKRILIKISGESLKSTSGEILDKTTIFALIDQIKTLTLQNYKIAIVVGGGNIWRGNMSSILDLDSQTGDYMGMVATIINGIAFRKFLKNAGIKAKLYSSFFMPNICECINFETMRESYDDSVLVFASGVGDPNFSTDSCAALRALELDCELLLVGKNGVDGVYDKDPNKYPDAKIYKDITYKNIIEQNLVVMDQTALTLCRNKNIEIRVFNIKTNNSIVDVLNNKIFYTKIKD